MDRTRARCIIEVGLNKKSRLPESLLMTVFIGRRNEQGRTAKGDAAFSEGVEHIVLTYDYQIDTTDKADAFNIPRPALKLLK